MFRIDGFQGKSPPPFPLHEFPQNPQMCSLALGERMKIRTEYDVRSPHGPEQFLLVRYLLVLPKLSSIGLVILLNFRGLISLQALYRILQLLEDDALHFQ